MTVEQIQLLLKFLGYDPGPLDGLWGAKTAAALTQFQKQAGLTADGEAGVQTQQALRRAVGEGELPRQEEGGTIWDDVYFFTRAEFACKCGQYHEPYCDGYPAEMNETAVRIADGIRSYFGKPGHIVSGLRCRQHNADSGGVANSQHMDGTAVDIFIEGVKAGQILGYLEGVPGVRYAYAINDTNVHFDVPRG